MAWPVQLALAEKGIPYRSRCLSFSAGEQRQPEFLALNPRGKVPVLCHHTAVVYESHACVDYLERQFREQPLLPDEPELMALDLTRRAETAYLYPAADPAISYTSYSSTLRQEDWDAAELERLALPLMQELGRWETAVSGSQWLVSDSGPTQSDLFLIPLLLYLRRFAFDFSERKLPALAAYTERALARASVQETWPPHWHDSEGDPTFALR